MLCRFFKEKMQTQCNHYGPSVTIDYENIRNIYRKIRWLRPFLDDFQSQILTLPLKNDLKNVWSLPKFFMDKNIPRLTLTSCNASRLHLFRPTGIKIGGGGSACSVKISWVETHKP